MGNEIYENWKKQRTETKVPAGFAGRVMGQIAERAAQNRTWAAWICLVALPRIARVAACLLAALVGLVRMTQVMGALIP